MERKTFLKGLGFLGVGGILPKSHFTNRNTNSILNNECVIIPSETAGPFPLDLTENSTFFRQDVRESEEGIQLNLKLRIIGLENCAPMQNVRVNIWHCDKDGVYSGYSTGNNPGDSSATHLRGYQFTDVNGEVDFITIFPGWYNGRICHIHFQVYINSSQSAISQLTFPLDVKNQLYNHNANLYTKGEDPLDFSSDNIFRNGHEFQLATLELDPDTGHYNSFMEVTVQGSGTTSTSHIESQTAKYVELGQNYPNPYSNSTRIPYKINQSSHVKIDIWDLSGKQLATIVDEKKSPGDYSVNFNPSQHNLSSGNYIYQIELKNDDGVFRIPKMMTSIKG